MTEKQKNIVYQHVPYDRHVFEYEPVGQLADTFKNADNLKPEVIKNYVHNIVAKINLNKDQNVQKACIMDLLRDESIKKLIKDRLSTHSEAANVNEKDIEEIEKMTAYWVDRIKKQIIDELKIYLPDDLYYFVTKKIDEEAAHFNQKSFVIDPITKKEYFLKESSFSFGEIHKEIEECFIILTKAQEELIKQGKKMPFVVIPENLGQSTKYYYPDKSSLSYLSEKKDISPVDNILVESDDGWEIEYKQLDEHDAKKVLISILDCLKGSWFLAQNGLTITDLNTEPIGKNFGINKKNGHGLLFDLDGIQKVGSTLKYILGPNTTFGRPSISLYAPEYRQFVTDLSTNAQTTSESMIWEIGQSILNLSNIQADKLFKSKNFFNNHKLALFWEKLRDFSKKMTVDKPAERPTFEVCIAKLEEIINKFSEQE